MTLEVWTFDYLAQFRWAKKIFERAEATNKKTMEAKGIGLWTHSWTTRTKQWKPSALNSGDALSNK